MSVEFGRRVSSQYPLLCLCVAAGLIACQAGAPGEDVVIADATPAAPDGPPASADAGTSTEDCYREPLHPDIGVDDIASSYNPDTFCPQILEAIARVWPGGTAYIEEAACDGLFTGVSVTTTWKEAINDLPLAMHETSHSWSDGNRIFMTDSMRFTLPSDANGFARSEIVPFIDATVIDDIYVDTYFTGEDYGARKLNAVLEELGCYMSELPVSPIYDRYHGEFGDADTANFPTGASSRDGTAAFLYYLELYVRRAKEQYPDYFNELKNDPTLPKVMKYYWLRAHLYFEVADNYEVGVADDLYRAALLYEPENLAALEEIVGAKLGRSNCVLPN